MIKEEDKGVPFFSTFALDCQQGSHSIGLVLHATYKGGEYMYLKVLGSGWSKAPGKPVRLKK